jgi:hypothetical protein
VLIQHIDEIVRVGGFPAGELVNRKMRQDDDGNVVRCGVQVGVKRTNVAIGECLA